MKYYTKYSCGHIKEDKNPIKDEKYTVDKDGNAIRETEEMCRNCIGEVAVLFDIAEKTLKNRM